VSVHCQMAGSGDCVRVVASRKLRLLPNRPSVGRNVEALFFLAGLAINGAVHDKPAKGKLQFFADSLFIPVFMTAHFAPRMLPGRTPQDTAI
jgi:hypothetical protein